MSLPPGLPAFRPAEAQARDVRQSELTPSPRLAGAGPSSPALTSHSGGDWTDSGVAQEERSLEHRDDDTREVPLHPELVTILRWPPQLSERVRTVGSS